MLGPGTIPVGVRLQNLLTLCSGWWRSPTRCISTRYMIDLARRQLRCEGHFLVLMVWIASFYPRHHRKATMAPVALAWGTNVMFRLSCTYGWST